MPTFNKEEYIKISDQVEDFNVRENFFQYMLKYELLDIYPPNSFHCIFL